MDPQKVEAAKKSRESLPAEEFPEGNWGVVTNGCQLSLRFTKTNYTNGEPVEVILLLRNVTNQTARLNYLRRAELLDGPATFQIISDSGKVIPEHYPSAQLFEGGFIATCPLPGTQHKYVEHLNRGYDLTNGTYNVRAVIRMTNNSPPTEVKSAPVTIKIK